MHEPTHHPAMLEAVPNLSTGADPQVVFGLVAQARREGRRVEQSGGSGAGIAHVADVHLDPDHDRCVVTVFGHGEALAATLVALAAGAVERIDLSTQAGVHPRIGALDVMPIIALDGLVDGGGTAADAEAMLLRVAATIGVQLQVPVLRYGRDVAGEELAGAEFVGALRRGGSEALALRLAAGEHVPIAGPRAPHPTAGVTVAGLRPVLVALNVDLDVGADAGGLEFARHVAARIRERADGPDALPGVRALGVPLATRGLAQVTMNVEQYRTVSPARVVEHVAAIAHGAGVDVHRVELVGLAPEVAVAQLRYACASVGAPISCATQPAIEWHVDEARRARMRDLPT